MSKVRIYGDTSGYVDIAVPAVAGTTTLNLDKIPQADINGNIAMDTDTLYVDAQNNKVGIGTNTPASKLHIKVGDNAYSGGIQIEDTDSTTKSAITHVDGGLYISSNATNDHISILANGNVGIGTASPSRKLTVKGIVGFEATNSTNSWVAYSHTDNTFRLNYNGAGNDEVVIQSGGNVGIGITSPSAPLDVVTNSVVYAAEFTQSNTSNGDGVFISVGSTASADYALTVRSDAGNTSVLAAKADGNVGIGTFTPASRLDVLNGTANTQVASFSGADAGGGLKILTASTTRNDDTVILKASDAFGEIAFTSDNTEVMRITKDNNVGIGTTTPTEHLEIKTSSPALKLTDTANSNNNIKISQGYNSYLTASNNIYMSASGHSDMLNLINGAVQVKKTRTGTISGGTSNTGAVIKLHTEAQWESGYGNNALATTNDYLGGIEFHTGDSSTGEGVRAAIRGTVDSYYNQNSIVFETAVGATAAEPIERMRVWHNGIVTKPYTPSFSCYKNGTQTEQTGNVNVTNWTENFDEGNNLNTSTGVFTAPVAGKYYFTFNAMHSGTMAGDQQYKIYYNGVYYQGSNDTGDGGSWDQCTVVTIINMNANDTANPVSYSSATDGNKPAVYTSQYSGWMGFLIG